MIISKTSGNNLQIVTFSDGSEIKLSLTSYSTLKYKICEEMHLNKTLLEADEFDSEEIDILRFSFAPLFFMELEVDEDHNDSMNIVIFKIMTEGGRELYIHLYNDILEKRKSMYAFSSSSKRDGMIQSGTL